MEIKISDLADVQISGVKYVLKDTYSTYKEDFFEWTGFPMVTKFKSSDIMCGLLQSWHHTPCFDKIEYHVDKELFYFIKGTAIMLFCDIVGGKPDISTSQIVRIQAGTELEIEANKAHFVAVAEDEAFQALVISPVQDAPRMSLPEKVCGKI
jgi:mannose-6-phosphate isomerase-like protein (cupin superfamily)